jgi:hypothetical protein
MTTLDDVDLTFGEMFANGHVAGPHGTPVSAQCGVFLIIIE